MSVKQTCRSLTRFISSCLLLAAGYLGKDALHEAQHYPQLNCPLCFIPSWVCSSTYALCIMNTHNATSLDNNWGPVISGIVWVGAVILTVFVAQVFTAGGSSSARSGGTMVSLLESRRTFKRAARSRHGLGALFG